MSLTNIALCPIESNSEGGVIFITSKDISKDSTHDMSKGSTLLKGALAPTSTTVIGAPSGKRKLDLVDFDVHDFNDLMRRCAESDPVAVAELKAKGRQWSPMG